MTAVLIVLMGSLGDIVRALPLACILTQRRPGARTSARRSIGVRGGQFETAPQLLLHGVGNHRVDAAVGRERPLAEYGTPADRPAGA